MHAATRRAVWILYASRLAPLTVMKDGATLRAPSKVATATCGLIARRAPSTAGCARQLALQLLLNRGSQTDAGLSDNCVGDRI
jgi:hypothetical protein